MNIKIYVGNLSKSTTRDELNTLFTQAGEVIAVDVIKDHHTGESRGFAFVTMRAQSEAEKAVNMFNAFTLNDHVLKVSAAKPIL
jgi:RNA recognition motif-containing protein